MGDIGTGEGYKPTPKEFATGENNLQAGATDELGPKGYGMRDILRMLGGKKDGLTEKSSSNNNVVESGAATILAGQKANPEAIKTAVDAWVEANPPKAETNTNEVLQKVNQEIINMRQKIISSKK